MQGWWLCVCFCAAPSRAGGCIASMRGQPMQAWAVIRIAASKRCASHELLPCVALAMMMAGCVLVCSTFKCRRMHCKHVDAANWTLRCKATTPRSTNGVNMSFLALCSLWKGGEYEGSCPDHMVSLFWHYGLSSSCPLCTLCTPCVSAYAPTLRHSDSGHTDNVR